MKSLRLFATLTATFALAAGATGAYAQTTLTMSSWVGPTHSLTRDVLSVWAKNVEAATQGRGAGGEEARRCHDEGSPAT